MRAGTADCDGPVDFALVLRATCYDAFEGTRTVGQTCKSVHDCVGGAYCNGTCLAYTQVGQACDTVSCNFKAPEVCSSAKVCGPPPELGEACDGYFECRSFACIGNVCAPSLPVRSYICNDP